MIERIAFVLALACIVPAARPVQAQQAYSEFTPAEEQAIHKVIQAQIEAFQRDDAAAAFALASPGIQEQIGTAENFLEMVRMGYEPVYRPRQYRFLDLIRAEGQVVQKVIVIGPDGLAVMAVYPMVRLKDGSWRTDGCVLVPLAHKDA
jgi:hypothetical protein